MLVVWGISDYNHQLKKKLCFFSNLPNLNTEELSAEFSYGFINTFPSHGKVKRAKVTFI